MERNINAVLDTTSASFTTAARSFTKVIDETSNLVQAFRQIDQLSKFNAIEPTNERKMLAVAAYSADNAEEGHVQLCLATLEEHRIRYVAEEGDRRIIIRVIGLPRVEYFPAKNRWRVAGNPKKQHGSADQLVKWIKESVR
jgi:hypothetical protein